MLYREFPRQKAKILISGVVLTIYYVLLFKSKKITNVKSLFMLKLRLQIFKNLPAWVVLIIFSLSGICLEITWVLVKYKFTFLGKGIKENIRWTSFHELTGN